VVVKQKYSPEPQPRIWAAWQQGRRRNGAVACWSTSTAIADL